MKSLKLAMLMLMVVTLVPGLGLSEKITFWHYWDGANLQALQSLIKQYEETHPGITIEAIFVPGAELLTKLQTP